MQYKVWNPGGVQKKNIAIDDQLQNKVWDPGRQGLKAHDQEIMINFNLGSLMQGHQAQENTLYFVDIGGSYVFNFLGNYYYFE